MLPNNRAINQGYDVSHCAFVGLKAVFAVAVNLRPIVNTPITAMQPTQTPSDVLPAVPAVVNTETPVQ